MLSGPPFSLALSMRRREAVFRSDEVTMMLRISGSLTGPQSPSEHIR